MQSEGASHQNVTEEVLKRVTRVQPKNDHYVMPAHLQSKGRLVKKSIMRLQQRMQYEFGEEEVSPTTNQATTPPTAQLYFNEQPKVRTSRDFCEDFATKQRKMQVVVKTKHVIAREAGRRSDGEPGLVSTDQGYQIDRINRPKRTEVFATGETELSQQSRSPKSVHKQEQLNTVLLEP